MPIVIRKPLVIYAPLIERDGKRALVAALSTCTEGHIHIRALSSTGPVDFVGSRSEVSQLKFITMAQTENTESPDFVVEFNGQDMDEWAEAYKQYTGFNPSRGKYKH